MWRQSAGKQREFNEEIITFNLAIGLIDDVETRLGRLMRLAATVTALLTWRICIASWAG